MKHYLLSLFLFAFVAVAQANNISVSNVTLTGQNVAAGANNAANYTMVQFSVSWDNSLRRTTFGSSNWDAAWIFVKFRLNGSAWNHARINNIGNTAPAGSTLDVGLQTPGTAFNITTNPGLGAFIYRSTIGSGTHTATNVQLRWNYGSQSITDNSAVEVQVYAVEMQYVPQGAFNVGGGGGTNAFTSTTINTSVSNTAPAGTGSLGGQAGGYPTGQVAPTITNWPNGFNAFYCMKYEISQQQYVDFLNNITAMQASARFLNNNGLYRNAITFAEGAYSTTNPYVACNFLTWNDVAAYLDWSAIRPMTELEFEKACRGNLPAVAGEYAWGSTLLTGTAVLLNSGLANELPSNAGANSSVGIMTRVGIFAGAATTRVQAGATYYGIMEMTGNVSEQVISIGTVEGRSFNGLNGDGSLSAAGEANTVSWPGLTAVGTGLRGGNWTNANAGTILRISDRTEITKANTVRSGSFGGRGVRTAP